MRIGIDARFYGPAGKGLGRYTQKLIKYLEQLDDANDYVVFLRKENFDEYRPAKANFRKVLADYRWYSLEEQILFPRLLKRHRLDLAHFPHFNIPVFYRGRFVVTIHDLILLHFPTVRATTLHPLWYRIKFLAYRFAIREAVFRSQKILTVSEFTKRDLLGHYAVPKEKVAVTYEAAEPFCFFQPEEVEQEILSRIGLVRDERDVASDADGCGIIRPYLLYVGNAYPHKNLEMLVEAVGSLAGRGARLVLVGKEDYFYKRLKFFAQEKGIENVVFAGFVPDKDLDVLYRHTRAYVFPSLYEGFGLPPLEAMGKGAPVVAARAASLPEVLGEAALYFDPESPESLRKALEQAWEDEGVRTMLRKKGYVQAGKFRWEAMAEETLRVYREVLRDKA
jgi:glycosyltransferase involved in cell wall biosynthesis